MTLKYHTTQTLTDHISLLEKSLTRIYKLQEAIQLERIPVPDDATFSVDDTTADVYCLLELTHRGQQYKMVIENAFINGVENVEDTPWNLMLDVPPDTSHMSANNSSIAEGIQNIKDYLIERNQ